MRRVDVEGLSFMKSQLVANPQEDLSAALLMEKDRSQSLADEHQADNFMKEKKHVLQKAYTDSRIAMIKEAESSAEVLIGQKEKDGIDKADRDGNYEIQLVKATYTQKNSTLKAKVAKCPKTVF